MERFSTVLPVLGCMKMKQAQLILIHFVFVCALLTDLYPNIPHTISPRCTVLKPCSASSLKQSTESGLKLYQHSISKAHSRNL